MRETLVEYLFHLRNVEDKGIRYIYGENDEEFVSYHEVYTQSKRMAKYLENVPYDKFLLQMESVKDYIFAVWACLYSKKILIPIKYRDNQKEAERIISILEMSEKTGIIMDESDDLLCGELVESRKVVYHDMYHYQTEIDYDTCVEAKGDDAILIQFSSGSTGKPKGVITTNRNLIVNMDCMIQEYNYEVVDKEINAKVIDWIPLTHNMGLIVGHFDTVMRGLDEFIIPTKIFVSNPMLLLEKIDQYRITAFHTPNFALDLITKCAMNYNKKQLDLSCLTAVAIGSEKCSEESMESFIKCLSKFKLPPNCVQPGYGLSEATVGVCDAKGRYFVTRYVDRNHLSIGDKVVELDKNDKNAVSFVEVGKFLGCLEGRITDDNNQPLGEGYVGRIKVKGDNVSPGYYKGEGPLEKLDIDDDGWLDTGDIGYQFGPFVTVIGRSKEMIIINGKNLYPSDFEKVAVDALHIPKSFVAVTGAYNDKIKSEEIVVFVKKMPEMNFDAVIDTVKKAIKEKTGYNAADVLIVDEIPKTSNGKVQRFRMVEIYQEKKSKANDDAKEKKLNKKKLVSHVMKIIRECLDDDTIEATDDISDYNVSSIYIIRIANAIKQSINYDASVKSWIASETFYDFIQTLKESEEEQIELTQEDQFEDFDLNGIQMAYYLGRNNDFELGNVSTHAFLEVETSLDMEKLNESFQKVIDNQPMLRTVVTSDGVQHVLREVEPYQIAIIDASTCSDEEKERIILEERAKSDKYIFDVETWPLFELKAVKLAEERYELMFGIDMLIADGASIQLIFKQMYEVYCGKTLTPGKITYKDYIAYTKSKKEKAQYEEDKAYWKEKVKTMAPPANLLLKNRPAEIDVPQFARKAQFFDKKDWQVIEDIVKANDVRITSALLYAYATVLGKWSNQSKLTISTTVFNRPQLHEDINELVGDFTSLMLVGVDLSKESDFFKGAKIVQDDLLTNLEHKDYDGTNVIRDYCAYNNVSFKSAAMPIVFTSMLFGGENPLAQAIDKLGTVKYTASQTSQVILDYQVVESNTSVLVAWDYVKNLFEPEVIDQMFNDYITLLKNIAASKANEVLENTELTEQYRKYNDTSCDIKAKTLHGMFKEQVEKVPENTAVKFKEKSLSYKCLDEASDKVAYYLMNQGVTRGSYITVMTERTVESIINLLAVLKTGAAYVPVNADYPEERIAYIKEETESFDVLNTAKCNEILESVKDYTTDQFVYDNIDDVAYIIYTSGSTGTPKGVVIKHSAAANTIQDINERYKVTQEDKIIGLSSLSFDLSVYDVFGALASGASLVLVEEQRDMEEIDQLIKEEKITIWNSVPMIMQMYMDYIEATNDEVMDFDKIPEVRVVMMSGDWIPVNLPDRIKEQFMDCEVISLGGATEASIWSIYYPIEEVKENWNSIPYGYPLANQTYYVLSEELELCPIGVKGNLYIGGVGLAEGYFKDEEKTNDAFINHKTYGRIYKTGDVGKMTKEGWIEFLGREDNQVKVRGYRIELTEIESELMKCYNVKNAVVISAKDAQGVPSLSGFVIGEEMLDLNLIRNKLRETLPEYMIPEYMMQIEAIPLSENGKVNSKELIKMQQDNEANANTGYGDQAKTETEKRLVEIWKETLGKENINIYRNFFDEGGNSILTIHLITQIEKIFGIKLNFKTFLRNCTVRELAQVLEKKAGKSLTASEKAEKLSENVIRISGGVHDSNVYLIKEGENAVLVDAGVRTEFIEKVVKEEGCHIKAVILTHVHYDHVFYADEIKKNSNAFYYMHNEEKSFALDTYLNGMDAAERTLELEEKDVLIDKEEDTITVDSMQFKCYLVPGHTKGSMCIAYKNYVFTGDALVPDNGEVPDLHYGNEEQLKQSKDRIINTFDDEDVICSGHGEVTKIKNLK